MTGTLNINSGSDTNITLNADGTAVFTSSDSGNAKQILSIVNPNSTVLVLQHVFGLVVHSLVVVVHILMR